MNYHPVRFRVSPVLASANGMGMDAVADCCRGILTEINAVLDASGANTKLELESCELELKGADGAMYPTPSQIADDFPIVIQIDWNPDDASTRGGGQTWIMDGGVGCAFITGTKTRKLYPAGTSGYVGGYSRLLYTITHELEHIVVTGDLYWQNDLPDKSGFEPNMTCRRGSPIHPYGTTMRRDPMQAQTVPFSESRLSEPIAKAFALRLAQGAHKPLPGVTKRVKFRTVLAGVPIGGIGIVTWAASSSGAGVVWEDRGKAATAANGEVEIEWPFGIGQSYLDNRALLVKAIPAPSQGKPCGAWLAWWQFHVAAVMNGAGSQMVFTMDLATGKAVGPNLGAGQTWPWREFEPSFVELQPGEPVPTVFESPAKTPWVPADSSSPDVAMPPGGTPTPTKLPRVTGLVTRIEGKAVRLTWDALDLPKRCHYKLWKNGRASVVLDSTTYLDAAVEPSTSYSFAVQAVSDFDDVYLDGDKSAEVEVLTPADPPQPPTDPGTAAEVVALRARVSSLESSVASQRQQFAEFESKLGQFKQWVAQL